MKSVQSTLVHIFMVMTLCAMICKQPEAATVAAVNCSDTAVQAAINAANDGDTVALPKGSAVWRKTVTVGTETAWNPPAWNTIALVIKGAGMDSTVIIDSIPTPASGNPRGTLLDIATKAGGLTRITGMTFNSAVYPNLDPDVYNPAMVSISGYSQTWRIDHVHFVVGTGNGITTGGSTYGVIDHNIFDLVGWHFGMYIFHPNWNQKANGDGSWADSLYAGTVKAIYIEDNVFNASPYSAAVDGWSGGRAVFRYNTLRDATIANHGTDSPGRLRSMRMMEIYNNTITLDDSAQYYYVGQLRGGTFIVFNNTITSIFPGAFVIENYRDYDTFDPWGKCDGTSPFDVNDGVTYDSGTCTGANGSKTMVCADRNWTPNQWQGYHVHNLAKGQSDLIVSNTADTLVTSGLTWHAPVLTWNNGDQFRILRATVCIDQRGRGIGDLISGDAPPYGTGITPQAWPHQAPEPTYAWNNTVNGSADLAKITSTNPWRIKENRDFYNSPMPGYTPFTYPHPLVGAGNEVRMPAFRPASCAASVLLEKVSGDRAVFRVSLRNPAPYRISVCDAQGRGLWEFAAGMGENNVTWRFGANGMKENGVYFVKVTSEKETISGRFTVVR
ncbi:MAG TPA: hypothetical protein VLX68_10655 [Chitinivibrionales bacterium]|nr:hypothetical protein [Chitinivibrionales bacterium]